jgi:ABC-type phosphate transport system permease subunit
MKCIKCETENPDTAKYCQHCGTALKSETTGNKYVISYLMAFIGIIIFLPLAVLSGIYLWTRPEPNAKKDGKNIIRIVLVLFIVFSIINLAINSQI